VQTPRARPRKGKGHPHPGLPQAACIDHHHHLISFPPRRRRGVRARFRYKDACRRYIFSSDGPPALRGMAWRLLHYIVCVVVRTLALQAPL